jgi:D-alanyl-D-alanine carboxypeptidase (penicillin-binding protein 5/6)
MRFLYLSMLSFVFIASCVLVLVNPQKLVVVKRPQTSVSPLPVLANSNFFPIFSAQGIIAVDLDSRVVLYEKDADLPLLPASTTKIATALVAMDYYSLDQILQVDEVQVEGQKMGLYPKEQLRVEDLLYGLLVYSANDAAEVLAQNYPGQRQGFIDQMNKKISELGLEKTQFTNPVGLDEPNQTSTARDMVRLAEMAMENPVFSQIVATKEKRVKDTTGKTTHYLTNINELLGTVDGVLGVKTGWTEGANENLVTYIKRGDHEVLIALLGSQDRFGETKELIDWIFANYSWQEISYSP